MYRILLVICCASVVAGEFADHGSLSEVNAKDLSKAIASSQLSQDANVGCFYYDSSCLSITANIGYVGSSSTSKDFATSCASACSLRSPNTQFIGLLYPAACLCMDVAPSCSSFTPICLNQLTQMCFGSPTCEVGVFNSKILLDTAPVLSASWSACSGTPYYPTFTPGQDLTYNGQSGYYIYCELERNVWSLQAPSGGGVSYFYDLPLNTCTDWGIVTCGSQPQPTQPAVCDKYPPMIGSACSISNGIVCEYNRYCCNANNPIQCFNLNHYQCNNGKWEMTLVQPDCPGCNPEPLPNSQCSGNSYCDKNWACCPSNSNSPTWCMPMHTGVCSSGSWVSINSDSINCPSCSPTEPTPKEWCGSFPNSTLCSYNHYCCPNNPTQCVDLTNYRCIDNVWEKFTNPAPICPTTAPPPKTYGYQKPKTYLTEVSAATQQMCPASEPQPSDSCSLPSGSVCEYDRFCCPNNPDDCINLHHFHCIDGIWQLAIADPACIFPVCPASEPQPSDSCSLPSGSVCEYDRFCCPNNPSDCINLHHFHCIDGVWQLAIADPACIFPVCPASEPQPSDSCSLPSGSVCEYDRFCCPNNPSDCINLHHLHCNDGIWQLAIADPACIFPVCPAAEPQPQTSCSLPSGSTCEYNRYCCPNNPDQCLNLHQFQCNDGVWQLAIADPACIVNPPPSSYSGNKNTQGKKNAPKYGNPPKAPKYGTPRYSGNFNEVDTKLRELSERDRPQASVSEMDVSNKFKKLAQRIGNSLP